MNSLTPSDTYGRCEAHHGRHGTYLGQCVLMGSEAPRRFTFRDGGNCGVCGVPLDIRYERGQRQAVALLAGTDTPHGHSQPAVSLDAQELAEAIVMASQAARQGRQRPAPPQEPQQAVAAPSAPPSRQTQPPSLGGLGGIPEFNRDG